MAKYYGSSWGVLVGKLGDAVGTHARGGLRTVRAYRKVIPSGSWLALETGKVDKRGLNIGQCNQENIVFGFLGHLTSKVKSSLIYPVWDPLTKRHHRYMSGFSLFMKHNATTLYNSLPDVHKFYGIDNLPDLSKLQLSTGVLEGADIADAHYDIDSGKVMVKWAPECFLNGRADDLVHLFVLHWSFPVSKESSFLPVREPWRTMKVWGSAKHPVGKRVDGCGSISISPCLNMAENFVVYLFFSRFRVGYSPSSSYKL